MNTEAKMKSMTETEAAGRNSDATKARIIASAKREFAKYGYSGARIDRISEGANANTQLIYRYFGRKEELYVAILEEIYREVREKEVLLELSHLSPLEGIRKLVAFTFDFLVEDPFFVRLMMNENLMEASFARKSDVIPSTTQPLLKSLTDIVTRGGKDGTIRQIDPVEIYIVILSLCFVHISNKHTLGIMFGKNISGEPAVSERRNIVIDVVTRFVADQGSV